MHPIKSNLYSSQVKFMSHFAFEIIILYRVEESVSIGFGDGERKNTI